MNEYVKCLIEFFILFIISFLYYKLIAFKKFKKLDKNKKKEVPELRLFVTLFKVDTSKYNYKKLSNQLSIIISFNLALTVVLATEIFNSLLLKIVLGFVVLLVSMYFGYSLLGLYYKKKGMCKDVQS